MEKICIYPEQGAEITAYERALNCLIFMLVYLLAGILCMFLPVIFGIHHLCGTGTTARMITEQAGLSVKGYNSGPLGGDQQVGAKIVEGQIDMVIFFSDPLTAQPHDPDVKALLRIAQVYDIPIANNKATADFLMHSTFMDTCYEHQVENFKQAVEHRAATL